MGGRWEVRIENGFGNYTKGPSTVGWVPVVPCDDAAIERAVRAMVASQGHLLEAQVRELFEVGLHAAGETP